MQHGRATLVVADAGPEAVVTCILGRDANLGHALLVVGDVARQVGRILEEL